MWPKISGALKTREGNDNDPDHLDTQSTSRSSPPNPFCIDATTHSTQQAPPAPPSGTHSRSSSREEDIVWSLRTQLALQQEICAQFEIDLAARDKLVEGLTLRLEASEKENDKRKSVVSSWKKKTAELEKMCRHLEEEVDTTRQESTERTIMDETNGEALHQLHEQISQLETERDNISSEASRLRAHVQQLQKDSAVMEVTIVQLNKQLDQDKEDINGLNIALESKQQELELVKRKHGARITTGPTAGRTNMAPNNAVSRI